MALAGADHGDPEARAGAYQIVEFLAGFRGLLKSLSSKPSASTPNRKRRG
jgi:hypothetical protein